MPDPDARHPDSAPAHTRSPADARTQAVFFDDGGLSPLDDLRPTFDLRVAALTGLERLSRAANLRPVALFVRPGLAAVVSEQHPGVPVNELPGGLGGTVLVINGRCHLPIDLFETLEPGEIAVERRSGDIIAANLTPDAALSLLRGENPGGTVVEVADHVLVRRPWGWIDFRDRAMQVDLTLAQSSPSADSPIGVIEFGENPVTIHPTARVYPTVVLDAEHGPIHIENHATVRPGAVICGPAVIGPSATISENAVIRANTAIGPHCKVGGEVSGTVFQGYSNKAHDGFLGDSWIGEWVNLGAGTTNSNLLNTYGEIKALAEPMDDREPTGRTFLGCVVGDHSKLAIGTRIMTGAVIHTANLYAAQPPIAGCAPGFCYVVGDDLQPYQFDKLVQTLVAVMKRRDIRPTEAYLQRLATLHGNAMAVLDALDDGSEPGPDDDIPTDDS